MDPRQTQEYLTRIGYNGNTHQTLDVLKALQYAHLMHVPFENLDIHSNIPIILDQRRLYEKIVLRRRGGFCYELNGLFYALLKALGYNTRRIAASVFNKERGYGPPYDHMAIIVTLEGTEYLADVGYGKFALATLRMEADVVQQDARGTFRIQHHGNDQYLVSRQTDIGWLPEYRFANLHRAFNEFTDTCNYHQTSPNSHFTKGPMISQATPDGRITLTENLLKIRIGDDIEERPIADRADFDAVLKQYFGIAPG